MEIVPQESRRVNHEPLTASTLPDYLGECDRCGKELPVKIDWPAPGMPAYCRCCWRLIAAIRHQKSRGL